MLLVKFLAVVLHIITAAALFGLGLLLGRQARAYASTGLAVVGELGGRSVRLMTMFAVLTFVFGLAAFFIPPGGFAVYGPEYHMSLTVMLVLVLVQILLVQRGWGGLYDAVASGTDPEPARKRVVMGVGIVHLLWLVLLVMMFWSNPVIGRLSAILGS